MALKVLQKVFFKNLIVNPQLMVFKSLENILKKWTTEGPLKNVL